MEENTSIQNKLKIKRIYVAEFPESPENNSIFECGGGNSILIKLNLNGKEFEFYEDGCTAKWNTNSHKINFRNPTPEEINWFKKCVKAAKKYRKILKQTPTKNLLPKNPQNPYHSKSHKNNVNL
jgi:hypothetical protein